VRSKACWADIICCTHQSYHRQWQCCRRAK